MLCQPYSLEIKQTSSHKNVREKEHLPHQFILNHQKSNIIPGLQNLEKLPILKEGSQFHILEYDGILYFLSTSDEQNVIKYYISGNYHRKIVNSKFPKWAKDRSTHHAPYESFERSLYASSFR